MKLSWSSATPTTMPRCSDDAPPRERRDDRARAHNGYLILQAGSRETDEFVSSH